MSTPHLSYLCSTHGDFPGCWGCPQCARGEGEPNVIDARQPTDALSMRITVQSQTIAVQQEHIESLSRQLVRLSERVEELARLLARANVRLVAK